MSLLSRLRRSPEPRRPRSLDGERHGFTLVEVLTVAVVMGTLVRIAIPNFHEIVLKARAAEVLGDFDVVRVAVENYHADHLQWPEDTYTGQIPDGLAEYLPEGFSFFGAGYSLDWENWVLPGGLPQAPNVQAILGISVVTGDRELGQAMVDLLGGAMAHYTLGESYTFVVERY